MTTSQLEIIYIRREYEELSQDFNTLLIKYEQMKSENEKIDKYCEKLEYIIKSNQYSLRSRPIV